MDRTVWEINFALFSMRRCAFLVLLVGTLLSCRDETPSDTTEPGLSSFAQLSAEDVSCTDAYLHLKLTATAIPETVTVSLTEAGTIYRKIVSGQLDTILLASSLLPREHYQCIVACNPFLWMPQRSATFTFSSLDTTSHNFAWECDTLGDGAESFVCDVAIVNDTLAYAVGQINVKDSLGNWTTYNVAKWNGSKWGFEAVTVQDYGAIRGIFNLKCIYAFSENDVWVASAANLIQWDGVRWNSRAFVAKDLSFNGQILKMWGTSKSNIILTGRNGAIYHYDGQAWQNMESSIAIDLPDVFGSSDGAEVWACGFDDCCPGTYLLRYDGGGWRVVDNGSDLEFEILSDSLSGTYTSVFTTSRDRVYVGSSAGLYNAPSGTRGVGRRLSFTSDYFPGFPRRVRGNGNNDITIAGDHSMIAHFNGFTWKNYSQFITNNVELNSLDQRGNIVMAAGVIEDPINSKGIIIIGRR